MLLWPTVAGLGFMALTGLVIVLGTATTARYEFEQNSQPQAGSRPAATLPFSNCTVITADHSAEKTGAGPTGAAAMAHR